MQSNNTTKRVFIITQGEITHVVGGAISVTINMCNLLVENGYDVYCICSSKTAGKPSKLCENVNFINLFYNYRNLSFAQAINTLSAEITPNLYIFFFNFLYTASNLDSKFDKIPKILMMHSRPDFYFTSEDELKKLEGMYKNTITQVLFENYKQLLPEFIKKNTVLSIPNSCDIQVQTINPNIEHKKIIYLSRIDCWKGLEFLIEAFALIANKYKDWSIDIYGQSQPPEYLNSLIKLTRKLNIDNQFHFKGTTETPIDVLSKYDFCVFPSYFEGFPVGLIESQSVGLPCIGLENSSGVNELIINEYNGFLTKENPYEYAEKIEKLINDKTLRMKFSTNALENSKIFNKTDIDECWLSCINDILGGKIPKSFDKYPREKKYYELFPISKIQKMYKDTRKKKWYKHLFSMENSLNKTHKIITILGIKISIKRKRKVN